jgi:hypothetical protein
VRAQEAGILRDLRSDGYNEAFRKLSHS